MPGQQAIFQSMTRNQGSQEAAYYLSLLAYFDNVRAKIDALPEGGGAPRLLVINVIVWGARYVDSLLPYSFPSLMAAGNIPQLARGRRVIIDIFTTQADRDAITASPAGKAVMACATLRFTIIADNLLSGAAQKSVFNYDRWLIAGAQQCSALHARRIGADVTFSPANYGPVMAPNTVILLRNALGVAFVEKRPLKVAYWALVTLGTGLSLLACRRARARIRFSKFFSVQF